MPAIYITIISFFFSAECGSVLNVFRYHLFFIQTALLRQTVSPPYPPVPNPWIQPTKDWRYSGEKKIPESSKKQNLNLLPVCNYLHNIYIVFTTIYIVLGIINNP